jgi:methylphosphotriester-DNA--protein-cysteine methyltransferase
MTMVSDEVKAEQKPNAQAASQQRELEQWAKTLGIDPARLKRAVRAVGITPKKIREYLRKNG